MQETHRHLIDELIPRDRDMQPPAFTPDYKTSALRSPRIPLWSLQLVSLACESLSRHGCRPATPAEARQNLGLEMAA